MRAVPTILGGGVSAYIVIIRNETRDHQEMAKYGELAPKAPIGNLKIIASKMSRFRILAKDARTREVDLSEAR